MVGDVKPEQQLSPADIRSYGVSSVSDLITQLAPQADAGGGPPVVLLNGKRISGFSEISDLPTEAILRVDILPEEAALQFGYPANQKVINVVLRRRFRSWTGELRAGTTTEGGRESGGATGTLVRIHGDNRTNITTEYAKANDLLESERGIVATPPSPAYSIGGNIVSSAEIDPALSALVGAPVTSIAVPAGLGTAPTLADFVAGANRTDVSDIGRYRTLSPATESLRLNGVLARTLPGDVSASLNAKFELTDSDTLQGLPSAALLVPGGAPYTPFAGPVSLYRYLPEAGALGQSVEGKNGHLGVTLNGALNKWRWSFNGAWDLSTTDTNTDRGVDVASIQAALDARDASLNPFAPLPVGLLSSRLEDRSHSRSSVVNGDLLLAGPLFSLPAGKATANLRGGVSDSDFSSRSQRAGILRTADFDRGIVSSQASIDLPIASRRAGVLNAIGDLSLNANAAAQRLSDFGTLSTIGYGLRWSPIPAVRLIASISQDRAAPSTQQIGNPLVVTPNYPVFDYAVGQTVLVSQIAGGNPDLRASNQHQLRLSATVKPFTKTDFTLTGSYTRSRTNDPIASFPAPTPQIEAAFPDRFVRDADGTLLQINARPINFDQSRSQRLRWGFNLSLPIKSHIEKAFAAWRASGGKPEDAPPEIKALIEQRRRGRPGAAPGQPPAGGEQRDGAGQAAPPPADAANPSDGARPEGGFRGGGFGGRGGGFGGGGRGGFGGGGNGNGGGRLQFALYHTWHIEDEVRIGPGVPVLDLLDGAAIGSSGGQPRHEIEGQAGYFNNGLGARLSLNWQSGTRVDGALGSPTGTLHFSSLATADLRLFANLGQMPQLVRNHPFLAGTRVTFSVQNLFDSRQDVRDNTGVTPLRYQPGYLDPLGRTVSISFRKQFF